MILGIGVDTVDVARFERTLDRTPRLRERLFAPDERERPVRSLAGRFAAKEALIKALGGSDGLGWHDMEIRRETDRRPTFARTERLLAVLEGAGAAMPHLSVTHDGGIATAFVVVEVEP
ncbi:holo-ACP synthase [Leucobacter chromiiresistens]|uniref:Holo-[acyl-carrier-protein] synthase n=1 Tax=Leucobacter chromiiresistens TaxID=1079994 RepID=A0A147EMN8_9MICO|nr:holo-ACP synthase [Leucobacter chromiiresistens]KTR85677.1 4'-phosphopantetheinyl transferase [Leucobacter chromiiresistens]